MCVCLSGIINQPFRNGDRRAVRRRFDRPRCGKQGKNMLLECVSRYTPFAIKWDG